MSRALAVIRLPDEYARETRHDDDGGGYDNNVSNKIINLSAIHARHDVEKRTICTYDYRARTPVCVSRHTKPTAERRVISPESTWEIRLTFYPDGEK